MKTTLLAAVVATSSALLLAAPRPAAALPIDLITTNNGFEQGLTDWTTGSSNNGASSFTALMGTTTPDSGDTVPAPPEGTHAAVSDESDFGGAILFRNFLVPMDIASFSASLNLKLYIQTVTDHFGSDQLARIDIMVGSPSDPFSNSASDVVQNVYQSQTNDPVNTQTYMSQSFDVTSALQLHPGESLRVRFEALGYQNQINVGVDDVHLILTPSSVPEPAGLALMGLGALGLLGFVRRESTAA